MQIRFARHLYVPAPGRVPATTAHHLREALRETGFAQGPSGEGLSWKAFRPAGNFATYADRMGLKLPTLTIEWSDEPKAVRDTFLPRKVDWSRCPNCEKIIPTDGSVIEHPMTGESVVVPIEMCISCGLEVDETWPTTDNDIVFSSAFYLSLTADQFASASPTISDALPDLVKTISAIADQPIREVFIAW